MMNVMATTLFAFWYNLVTKKTRNGPIIYQKWAGVELFAMLTYVIQIFFTLFGPTSCTVELLICEVIDSLSELFEDWQKFLSCKLAVIEIEEHKIKTIENTSSFNQDTNNLET